MQVTLCDVCLGPATPDPQAGPIRIPDFEFKDTCTGCLAAIRTACQAVIQARRPENSPFASLLDPQARPPVVPHEWTR